MFSRMRIIRQGFACVAIAGATVGAGLALKASGDFASVPWIPYELAIWCDTHGQLRNLPAFALLTFVALGAVSGLKARLQLAGVLAALGVLLEVVQIPMPHRHCDLADMILSFLGVVGGLGFFLVCHRTLVVTLTTRMVELHWQSGSRR